MHPNRATRRRTREKKDGTQPTQINDRKKSRFIFLFFKRQLPRSYDPRSSSRPLLIGLIENTWKVRAMLIKSSSVIRSCDITHVHSLAKSWWFIFDPR